MAEAENMWRCQMVNCGYVVTGVIKSPQVPALRIYPMTGAALYVVRARNPFAV